MASRAEAIPQLYTFTGTVTFSQTCFTGEFAPPCEVGEPGGSVSYTFVVDLAQPGERIVRDSSGETTTPIAGTFFAAFPFPGDMPAFGVVGPEPRVRVDENFGSGATLHSFIGIESEEFASFKTESSRHIVGLPGATLVIGAHFEGHQDDTIHAPGGISGRIDEIDSALTLTEIHGIAEPGDFFVAGVAVASLLAASIARRRQAG
jgi:hypothetical protein